MKKYCFMMTGNNVWLDVAIELYKNNIAEPVFWLGDDIHFDKAKEIFGKSIYRSQDLVHYQSNLNINKYSSESIGFFKSPNYLRAKDRCLKMMDRIDLYGLFNRLDREVVFNKLAIWILKEISEQNPEYLIMSEFAHSHAQYLVYEICDYLGMKIAKFNDWGSILPMMFLQNVKTGERYKIRFNFPIQIKDQFLFDINNHVNKLSNRKINDNYVPEYIKKIWQIDKFKHNYSFFIKDKIYQAKLFFFQLRQSIKKSYYKINPYKINVFQLNSIIKTRKKYLLKYCQKNSLEANLKIKFVYFALHFEPERTTNPDGGYFHDQFLALIHLRAMLPHDVMIYVKEHPTQIKRIKIGIKGRSPLFYELIKEIDNVSLVDINSDTYSLTMNSLFVATITGTAAREAAIMGKKALIFGDSWFNGCPNVFSWNENLTFDQIISSEVKTKKSILNYLKYQMDEFGIPGCQNPSSQKIFKNYLTKEFNSSEFNGVYKLIENFLNK